ncbi:MAG: hypothetical protein DRG36_05805 [Deltaproteobacteria bacterium]|nr:MAG: hypothetical protein DRG36_05805 [Deltaproteobacteria bacterium]
MRMKQMNYGAVFSAPAKGGVMGFRVKMIGGALAFSTALAGTILAAILIWGHSPPIVYPMVLVIIALLLTIFLFYWNFVVITTHVIRKLVRKISFRRNRGEDG